MNILSPVSSAMAISCPFCYSAPGDKCVKRTSGKPAPFTHARRWEWARWQLQTREMWFVLCKDDERFGLLAGDILRCIAYPYDSKVSVLFREWDGYDPECNQYMHNVAFLGFVPHDMAVYGR